MGKKKYTNRSKLKSLEVRSKTDSLSHSTKEVVILDFETTGFSANFDRVIEVGAVILKDNQVVDNFSQLMNPGFRIPFIITALTGITNEMVEGKPSPEMIMPKLMDFIGDRPILAHNASFDARFLASEMARANIEIDNPMICTMLLSRRLIPEIDNHRLGTIARYLGININREHRALDDVELTARVWNYLHETVCDLTGLKVPEISLFQKISKKPKRSVPDYLSSIKAANA